MACVRRTRKEGVVAVDLAREHHSVAVVWEECVLKLVEWLEVLCPCHSDGRSGVAVAPCDIVLVLELAYAWVIAVHPFPYLRDVALELEGLRVELPVDAVLSKSRMEGHPDVGVIHTEHTCISVSKRHYGRIEYAV